jgi:hypothetical protein
MTSGFSVDQALKSVDCARAGCEGEAEVEGGWCVRCTKAARESARSGVARLAPLTGPLARALRRRQVRKPKAPFPGPRFRGHVLEMHYAHLVDGAEDVARAKLDARAAVTGRA